MSDTRPIGLVTNELKGVKLCGYRETIFFSTIDGQLCQWIEIDLEGIDRWRKLISLEIRSGKRSAKQHIAIRQGKVAVRCYAPALWPDPPDTSAELVVTCRDEKAVGTITIGSHRPWTLYLLSDCCADDTWAYSDLEEHDRDDYRTTVAELMAGKENCYNYPSVYQIERFFRYATSDEKKAFREAVGEGRFYISPVPNQLLCGAFTLAAYPLLLEPYRRWCSEIDRNFAQRQGEAYHMEAPSWTNGLVNLFSCAGFRLFGKSLLRFLAPWIDLLEELPVLTRLQVAPDRFVYLVLRANTYVEGFPILAGRPCTNQVLHQEIIPRYTSLGEEYPVSAIPIVGLYGDLEHDLPDYVAVKVRAVDAYHSQGWEYPRLVNATWRHFADHVERELGDAQDPKRPGLRTIRGDVGSSWEGWMMSAQEEAGRFRRAQRDLVSVRALEAILDKHDPGVDERIKSTVGEVVALGDHAWNGTFEASKRLNLEIRRTRLSRIEENLAAIRSTFFTGTRQGHALRFGVVNTLGWARTCLVCLPEGLVGCASRRTALGRHWNNACISHGCMHLVDLETRETFPLYKGDDACYALVPDVPGFGFRKLEARPGVVHRHVPLAVDGLPLAPARMRPLLILGDEEQAADGGWDSLSHGAWRIGPFIVDARIVSLATDGGADGRAAVDCFDSMELELLVRGDPPQEPYELRWEFALPWEKAAWRGESGGGFVTLGPADRSGDSLLGITGSVFSCGEGLSVTGPDGQMCIDLAFDQSGMCGIGGRSTQAALGSYGERLGAQVANLSVWTSLLAEARLELYILGNKQNFQEALLDQGGTRQWKVRCGLRRRPGSFDDVALYHFACGFNYPAELVDLELLEKRDGWLTIQDGRGIIPLSACQDGGMVQLDFYNTLQERTSFTLTGTATQDRIVQCADMLGRIKGVCAGGRVEIDPLAFMKVMIG